METLKIDASAWSKGDVLIVFATMSDHVKVVIKLGGVIRLHTVEWSEAVAWEERLIENGFSNVS